MTPNPPSSGIPSGSSDGGGKAREWTLCRIDLDLMSRGDVLPPRVVVVEKEWADRQLADAGEALRTARRRLRQIHEAGFDFRRREITTDAICEIDVALRRLPDDS